MRHRESVLDLVRGLSALLVMLGHLRGFIFRDFGEIQGAGIVTKLFYFATGLGHQAVMVFFVLSGYFVGGSILAGLANGRFTWHGYALARLSRLWMVLLPALLLTLGMDMLGQRWIPEAYAGSLGATFMSGPQPGHTAAHDIGTFIGNLGFVQTVSVPVFGTNGPLWSLANEFWYYVMFPLLAVGLVRLIGGHLVGLLLLLLLGLFVWWLPYGLVMGGLIWLLGVGVWWVLGRQGQAGFGWIPGLCRSWAWRVTGGCLFLGTLAASKSDHWMGSDGTVGFAFAMWTLSLTGGWHMPNWVRGLVTGLSEISYTLYVTHFPLLFFVAAVVLNGRQFPANGEGFLWFGGLAVATLVISIGMWWLFERNTDRMRKWLLKIMA